MNNKIGSIISVVVLGLAIIVLGAAIGMIYTGSFQIAIFPGTEEPLVKNDCSNCEFFKKVQEGIIGVGLSGEVVKIEGNKITISKNNASIIVEVKKTTSINSVSTSEQSKQNLNARGGSGLKIEDIKKGDNVNVSLKFLPDGTWEPISIFIVPSIVTK